MKSNYVDRSTVMAVPQPSFTSTWHPVSHAEVLRALFASAEANNVEIVSEKHSLASNGSNLFSTFTINGDGLVNPPGIRFQLGLRNSLNKTMAIGITTGTHVVVCSNMMFTGEFITFRKHTNGLDLQELYLMMGYAVYQSVQKLQKLADWHESMKGYLLWKNEHKGLIFDAMRRGAVAPSKFDAWCDAYDEERKLNGETLFSWHGAGTRVCRDESLFSISNKTTTLNAIADDYMMALAA